MLRSADRTIGDLLATYGLAPSLQQQQLTKGGAEAAVGDVQQQQKQNEINAEIAKYNFNQMAPAEQAQLLVSLLGGIPGGTTTATGNVPTPKSNNGGARWSGIGCRVGKCDSRRWNGCWSGCWGFGWNTSVLI